MLYWVRQPVVVWLLLAVLYLTSAILSILLAVAMTEWWPLLITLASMIAAGTCAMTALDSRP
ncbi:MAG TPA: hypothetical protein VGX25_30210 [Actinophytocola sp.]|uniref:hypothetical protein n=1 Tax=Actinophytocola sp. TaxID=1872138 RepID=UPI002DDC933A|nr:hypothetical protein [Actinophytocola sp.]HEV2783682.1 hypothetical protein [Actinophytocola sp.]